MFLNDILCLVQQVLDAIVGGLNSALGSLLGFEIPAIDVGCEVADDA